MLPLFMSVSITLTSKRFIALCTFEVIFSLSYYRLTKDFTKHYYIFLKKRILFEQDFLAIGSHY